MNDNKVARVLNRIFHAGFFASFFVTLYYILNSPYAKNYKTLAMVNGEEELIKITIGPLIEAAIYIGAVLMPIVFGLLYCFSYRYHRKIGKLSDKDPEKLFRLILFITAGVLLLIQLYCGYILRINPRSDLLYIHRYAVTYGETGSFERVREMIATRELNYLARYPNNFTIFLMVALMYRLSYLLTGSVSVMFPTVFNTLAINISIIFAVLTARHIMGRRKALFVLFITVMFATYYAYTPFYYTDSLSMPFAVIGLYLFVLGVKNGSGGFKSYIQLAAAGMVIFIGFKVKGSVAVILPVGIVYSLLKFRFKEFVCIALALFIGFGSFFVMYNVGYDSVGLVSEEFRDEYEFPYTHWVMMGLKGKGGYNLEDSEFTQSFKGKDNKREANIEEIKARVSEYIENHQLIEHLFKKAAWMWSDGTYYVGTHIFNCVERCWLHEFFLRDGKYYEEFFLYANAYQIMMIGLMLISMIKAFIKPRIDLMVMIRGCVFAVFVFLLIWEGRSRYLFNFTPLYIIMAADGLFFVTDSIRAAINKRKLNAPKHAAVKADDEAVQSIGAAAEV